MNDESQSDPSDVDEMEVGMHISSDPDRTEIEQPDTTGAREVPSLPFRVLLVSDLAPASRPDDWSTGSPVREVDANSFADVMADLSPALSLEVENTLTESPQTWDLALSFSTLEAFEPEAVARQVAPLAQLLEVRALVRKVGDGTIDADTFRAELDELGVDRDWAGTLYQRLAGEEDEASSGADGTTGEGDESLDRLMGMVDVEDDDQETGASGDGTVSDDPVDALVDAVRDDDARDTGPAEVADELVSDLNEMIREQLRPILDHPDVRDLESAWRGLKFLVDRFPFRSGIELTVLPAGRDDLHEALHHQVLLPEHDEAHDAPPTSLLLVDQAFGKEHRDIEQLADLAGTGKSLQAPVVASVEPSFFGMESIRGLRKLPSLRPALRGDEYVEWESLREEDHAQYLGLALPPVLLRASHDEAAGDLVPDGSDGLWGSGALAVGVAAAQSVADTGWPTHLDEVDIEGLPVQSGPGGTSPLAALLPGRLQSELARAGFTVLSGEANRDAVRVAQGPTVRDPGAHDDPNAAAEARAEAALPCRLFAARAAHRVLVLEDALDLTRRPIPALQEEVAAAMASFLDVPTPETPDEEEGDGEVGEQPVSVEHVEDVDLPNQEVLAIRVRPPDDILRPNVRVAMALRVPRASQE